MSGANPFWVRPSMLSWKPGGSEREFYGGSKVMTSNYYVLRDDRDNWFYSESPNATGAEKTCRTRQEALDLLEYHLAKNGLVVVDKYNHPNGLRVEAMRPSESPKVRKEILYSSDCLNTVDFIKDRLDRILKDAALDITVLNRRKIITGDDVFEALDGLGLSAIYPDEINEATNGR